MNKPFHRWINPGSFQLSPHSVKHAVYVTHKTYHGIPIFDVRKDYVTYLRVLNRQRLRLKIRIFAYCVLPNAVHLLADAGANVARIHQLMHMLAHERVTALYGDDGNAETFWPSSCESVLPVTAEQLITTSHVIEQQPVMSCLATAPSEYPWSSWCAHTSVNGRVASRYPVDSFPEYIALGASQRDRALAYEASAPTSAFWQQQLALKASQAGYLGSW